MNCHIGTDSVGVWDDEIEMDSHHGRITLSVYLELYTKKQVK